MSTATSRLKLEKPAVGGSNNSWGTELNGSLDAIDEAIAGMETVSLAGVSSVTLSDTDYADNQARAAILKATGLPSANATIIVPSRTKQYTVWNALTNSTYTLTIKTSGGTGVAVTHNKVVELFCDGTNVYAANTDSTAMGISSGGVANPLTANLSGADTYRGTNFADPQDPQDLVTLNYLNSTLAGVAGGEIPLIITSSDNVLPTLTLIKTGTAPVLQINDSDPDSSPVTFANDGRVEFGGGATGTTAIQIALSNAIDGGATSYGVAVQSTVATATPTTGAYYYFTQTNRAAGGSGLTDLVHFGATEGTINGVTNQYGFSVDATLDGATNNYGFYSGLTSGAGKWNIYMAGSANNAIAGNTRFGGTTAPVATVDVTGTIATTGAATIAGGVDKLTTATGAVSVAAATAPTSGQVLTATGATTATWQDPGAASIADNSITVGKLEQIAQYEFLSRNTSGSGNVEKVSRANVVTALAAASGGTINQGLHMIALPAAAWQKAATDGATASSVTTNTSIKLTTWQFSISADQEIVTAIPMPEGWNANSTLVYQVEFSYTGASTGHKIAHAMKIAAVSSGDSTTLTFGTAVQVNTDLGSSQPDKWHRTADSAAVTPGNTPAQADTLIISLKRLGTDATNDTLDKVSELLTVRLYYTINAATDS